MTRREKTTVGSCLIGGAAAIVVGEIYLTGLPHHLVRDLGIALLISGIVASLIEFTLARDLAAQAIGVAMRSVVAPDVWNEIREHIVLQPVIRNKYCITVDVKEDKGTHGDNEQYVATTQVDYYLETLTQVPHFVVQHHLDSHRSGRESSGQPLPRYERVAVEGVSPVYEGDNLKEILRDNGCTIQVPVKFAKTKDVRRITITAKELIRVPDAYSWWMPIATRNAEFKCTAPEKIGIRVKAHHPERDERLDEKVEGKHWYFDGTMLPGQALEVQTFDRLKA